MTKPLTLLLLGDESVPPRLDAHGVACRLGSGASHSPHDGVLVVAPTRTALAALSESSDLAQLAFDQPVIVLTDTDDAPLEAELLRLGVQAIVGTADLAGCARVIRQAIVRKQADRSARTAYATDLTTGLPHEAQLIEHMTQLLALREREPAPLVVLALRVEGYAMAASRLGGEAANVLRRKVAVRLRGGLRASDIVASIGPEMFAVLLGRIEAPGDGERVAAKLVRALQQPFMIAGQACTVAVEVGLAACPEHGKDAAVLLQRAVGQAAGVATLASHANSGFAVRTEFGDLGRPANDAEP